MLWSKQYYFFDLDRWLEEHDSHPARRPRQRRRGTPTGSTWSTTTSSRCPTSGSTRGTRPGTSPSTRSRCRIVDLDFAKEQLLLMLRRALSPPERPDPRLRVELQRRQPAGARLGDALRCTSIEQAARARADRRVPGASVPQAAAELHLVGQPQGPLPGATSSQGGFLGLDNIGVFDRSAPLPTGGTWSRPTAPPGWRCYCQNMLEIALDLADHDAVYEEIAFKFVEHFLWIAAAMDRVGEHHDEMWDEEDGFFYDVLRLPDGQAERLKVRSMVGLLPLCATTVLEADDWRAQSETDGG